MTSLAPDGPKPVLAIPQQSVVREVVRHFGSYSRLRISSTEEIAVLEVLSQRPVGSQVLTHRLSDPSVEIRLAVATRLVDHLSEPAVVAALGSATTDNDPAVGRCHPLPKRRPGRYTAGLDQLIVGSADRASALAVEAGWRSSGCDADSCG